MSQHNAADVDGLLIVDTSDAIATVTLNRPDKRNALNLPLIDALRTTFANLPPH